MKTFQGCVTVRCKKIKSEHSEMFSCFLCAKRSRMGRNLTHAWNVLTRFLFAKRSRTESESGHTSGTFSHISSCKIIKFRSIRYYFAMRKRVKTFPRCAKIRLESSKFRFHSRPFCKEETCENVPGVSSGPFSIKKVVRFGSKKVVRFGSKKVVRFGSKKWSALDQKK